MTLALPPPRRDLDICTANIYLLLFVSNTSLQSFWMFFDFPLAFCRRDLPCPATQSQQLS